MKLECHECGAYMPAEKGGGVFTVCERCIQKNYASIFKPKAKAKKQPIRMAPDQPAVRVFYMR